MTELTKFDENEIEFGRAAVAMLADGYEPARCHWLVTCAMLAFRQMAAVQARRDGLRVVDAVPPGAAGTRRSRRKKRMTGGLRVIDGDGAAQS
jgi:hypothetical protein